MPFKSEKQRRYLHANHPEIAKRWERDYANGGISQLVQPGPGRPGYRGDAAYASKSEQSKKEYGGQGQTPEARGDTSPRDYGEGPETKTTVVYTPPDKEELKKIFTKPKKKKKKKNILDDIAEDLMSSRLNRTLYNLALGIPGSKKRIKNYRKKYKEYLQSMGAKGPTTLDDEDLFEFWKSDAFNYEPPKGMNYGAFLLDEFNNPGVAMSGNVGNFYAMEKPDWF